MTYSASNYQLQLDEKLHQLKQDFMGFSHPDPEVFNSPPSHFRMRAEFRIWHQHGIAHYAMNKPGEKRPYLLDTTNQQGMFPIGSTLINQLMPLLINAINQNDALKSRLFSAEFLTTLSGEAVISLIYHRKLDEQWQIEAAKLATDLGISIIGRSRKQKCVVGNDYVTERLSVNGQHFSYQQVETGFTQPNAQVNQHMLSWALRCSQGLGNDLLELYCGNGNFTCVLAQNFNRVLATEVAKVSVKSALYNLSINRVDNVHIVRMSSEALTEALNKIRPFRRLKDINLDDYNFSTVFVDPPRAGLDDETLALVSSFSNIIYISCNPETLKNNLQSLTQTHKIEHFAVFDQFPYTHHLETGVLLKKLQTI